MKMKFDITGMNCSACSARIEKALSKLKGVKNVNVNLLNSITDIWFDENLVRESDIISAIQELGYGAFVHKKDGLSEHGKEYVKMRKKVLYSFLFAIPLFYISMGEMFHFPLPEILTRNIAAFVFAQLLLLLPIVIINFKYFKNGYKSLFKLSPNMDSLIAIGSSASIIYGLYSFANILNGVFNNDLNIVNYFKHNIYFESAGTILTIVTLGKFLEFKAKENTKSAITKLLDLSPKFATVLRNENELKIKTEEIEVNEIIIIKAGDIIPTDGVIIEGKCSVDESMLTGESIPILKKVSENVTGGTINKNGFIKIKATKIGEDTTLAKIIKLVEDANSSKAPIGKTADAVSAVFVPVVIMIAIVTFIVWILSGKGIDFSLSMAISVLVISCPCALGLATPATIMVGTGKGAENGILFKNAEVLENVYKIDTVVLDKTGTITKGEPVLEKIISLNDMSENEILKISGSLEHLSEHTLAHAILNKAKEANLPFLNVDEYVQNEGKGIKGIIDGHSYVIGNLKMLEESNIHLNNYTKIYENMSESGKIPIIFCKDGVKEGVLVISDVIKPSSKTAIKNLKELLSEVIMLTGDNKKSSEKIGKEVGISNIISEVLPQEKENIIKLLQAENKKVMMVGDGINDSPALARANIGVAIGSGSDIAIETADIVLLKNNLIDVVNAINLSHATIMNIKQNLFWALFYNIVGIPVAAGCFSFIGLNLNPMIAASAMGLSSLFVVGNALRLKTMKLQKTFTECYKNEGTRNMKKEIYIEGMMCMHCVNHVKEALSEIPEIEDVDVSLEDKKAVITYNKQINSDILKKIIDDLGYVLKDIKDLD